MRAQAIVDQLLKAIEPERRLRGIAIDVRVSVGDRMLLVDEDLLVTALSGLLTAAIGLTEEPSAFTVTVTAEAKGSDVVFGISQDQAAAPSNWIATGPVASCARIVTALKGRVIPNAGPNGCDLRVAVPRTA